MADPGDGAVTPRVLRPSDYEDGRPDLESLYPFIGGTVRQQRAEIERRRLEWAARDAATEAERVRRFFEGRDQRGAEHERNPTHE